MAKTIENLLNTLNHLGNANSSNPEVSSHPNQSVSIERANARNTGEDVEKERPLLLMGLYSHAGSSQKKTKNTEK